MDSTVFDLNELICFSLDFQSNRNNCCFFSLINLIDRLMNLHQEGEGSLISELILKISKLYVEVIYGVIKYEK